MSSANTSERERRRRDELDLDTRRGATSGREDEAAPADLSAFAGTNDREALGRLGVRGPGGPLPDRAALEEAYGVDLGHVTLHTDASARAATAQLGTRAYALGSRIAAADPAPPREIIAHEVAHVVQQGAAPRWRLPTGGAAAPAVDADPEQEADVVAALATRGAAVDVRGQAAPSVQAWGGEDHYAIGNLAADKALAAVKGNTGVTTRAVTSATPNRMYRTEQPSLSTVVVPTGGEGISFGAATRYGGDYTVRPLDDGRLSALPLPDALEEKTEENDEIGRLSMVKAGLIGHTNANHFYPGNHAEYANHHALALAAARQAAAAKARGDREGAATHRRTALIEEGFGSHFLADCYASGHLTPRALDDAPYTAVELVGAIAAQQALGLPGSGGEIVKAYRGFTRSKSWHDFLCALPEGVQLTDGHRYHGDHNMDGDDLGRVSDVASRSLADVLDVAEGRAASRAVTPPRPDIGRILADPVVGPVWRVMMGEYEAARASIDRTGSRTSDGGTTYDQRDAMKKIDADIFGRGAVLGGGGAGSGTAAAVTDGRGRVRAVLDAIAHYGKATWGANPRLGQDDDLQPTDATQPNWPLVSAQAAVKSAASVQAVGLCDGLAAEVDGWATSTSYAMTTLSFSASIDGDRKLVSEARALATELREAGITSTASWEQSALVRVAELAQRIAALEDLAHLRFALGQPTAAWFGAARDAGARHHTVVRGEALVVSGCVVPLTAVTFEFRGPGGTFRHTTQPARANGIVAHEPEVIDTAGFSPGRYRVQVQYQGLAPTPGGSAVPGVAHGYQAAVDRTLEDVLTVSAAR